MNHIKNIINNRRSYNYYNLVESNVISSFSSTSRHKFSLVMILKNNEFKYKLYKFNFSLYNPITDQNSLRPMLKIDNAIGNVIYETLKIMKLLPYITTFTLGDDTYITNLKIAQIQSTNEDITSLDQLENMFNFNEWSQIDIENAQGYKLCNVDNKKVILQTSIVEDNELDFDDMINQIIKLMNIQLISSLNQHRENIILK